jgi:two-component system cell cycle response regulator
MKPVILIADDDPTNVRMLGELLKNEYDIYIAGDGTEAVKLAKEIIPDLILLDVMMPGLDGYAVCRLLRGNGATAEIPVIFVTARNNADDIVRGFEAGGMDYIAKPFYPQELYARIKTHIDLKNIQKNCIDDAVRLEEANRKLAAALEQMEIMARVDPLTGLANRRYFLERIEQEVARSRRKGRPLSIVMTDIDDFKKINDTNGHDCGDAVLRRVADIMRECTRLEDMAARWGGEEFLLFFVETPIEEAVLSAERIRKRIAASTVEHRGVAMTVTVTIGVVLYNTEIDTDANIRRVDDAMYRGKRLTKNCVVADG